ncbi:obscurin-like [Pectinophora gossypiella]|uniref:obscurin-like n=1 Tax=Pectinophora gossypiella TaxID=13191 RepID=UPI00214E317E|nr:obscurin-like [Pectinophora gossypiella]
MPVTRRGRSGGTLLAASGGWVTSPGEEVSWVRSSDLQILVHGGAVFTADGRVSVPALAPRLHGLTIARLRAADAGRYECQLNTEPKSNLFFDLTVLDEAEAAVETTTEAAWEPAEAAVALWALGGGDVWAARGAAALLACAATRAGPAPPRAPPLDIRWLRGGQPLVLQDGDSMERSVERARATSRLRLAAPRPRDEGEYTCVAAGHRATLRLHLRDEENMGEMEAMQRDQSAGGGAGAARPAWAAALAAVMLPRVALVAL